MWQMEEALAAVNIGDDVVVEHQKSSFSAGGLYRGKLVGRTKIKNILTVQSEGVQVKYSADGYRSSNTYGSTIHPATGEKLAELEKQEAARAEAATLLADKTVRQDAVKIHGSKVAEFVAEFEMKREDARATVVSNCEWLIRELRHTIDSLTPGKRKSLHGHLTMPQMLSTIAEGIGNFNALDDLHRHMCDALEVEKLK